MIKHFYTTSATNRRNTWVTIESLKSSSLEVVATFDCHIQQANPQMIQNIADNYTISHIIWCDPATDVKVGDVIYIGDDRYDVRLLQDNSFVGSNKHYELMVEKQLEYGS
jgi:hypothetical protein